MKNIPQGRLIPPNRSTIVSNEMKFKKKKIRKKKKFLP